MGAVRLIDTPRRTTCLNELRAPPALRNAQLTPVALLPPSYNPAILKKTPPIHYGVYLTLAPNLGG